MYGTIDVQSFTSKIIEQDISSILKEIGVHHRIFEGECWLLSPFKDSNNAVIVVLDAASDVEKISKKLACYQADEVLLLCPDDDIFIGRNKNISQFDSVLAPISFESLHLPIMTLVQKNYQVKKNYLSSSINPLLSNNLIGQSAVFNRTLSMIEKVAGNDVGVYVYGETGTGKELTARSIHYLSDRCDGPFIPVNCGALSDELMLSELFGHEKGAFTSANKHHIGLLEQADKGTLFLDEVDSLSQKAQVTLLRYLQEQEFRSLGSTVVKYSNARIIVASNTPLDELVTSGKFRMDLLFRLDVLRVTMPPLRERDNDFFLLVQYFLDRQAERWGTRKVLHPDVIQWMFNYSWPGNIRELDNFILRAYLISEGGVITASSDCSLFSSTTKKDNRLRVQAVRGLKAEKETLLQDFELQYLSKVLAKFNGNVSLAAKFSGKERSSFSRLMKKYGLSRQQFVGVNG